MPPIEKSYGTRLRDTLAKRDILPFVGIYDVFSASIAAQHHDALFLSGFGLAASYYGLPDFGFIAWPDVVGWVQRVRSILPRHHLLVDIDDGYCDTEVACHVVSTLESAGASGVVLEDQGRPRKCGHFSGKQLLEVERYLEKLDRVLYTRNDLFVVARTDASDPADIERRVRAFTEVGPDAVLVDGLVNLEMITRLKQLTHLPLVFNQIAGGRSPSATLTQLRDFGASLVIYSTPCLFAAQQAISEALTTLWERDGRLPTSRQNHVGVPQCTAVLKDNLERRDQRYQIESMRKAA